VECEAQQVYHDISHCVDYIVYIHWCLYHIRYIFTYIDTTFVLVVKWTIIMIIMMWIIVWQKCRYCPFLVPMNQPNTETLFLWLSVFDLSTKYSGSWCHARHQPCHPARSAKSAVVAINNIRAVPTNNKLGLEFYYERIDYSIIISTLALWYTYSYEEKYFSSI